MNDFLKNTYMSCMQIPKSVFLYYEQVQKKFYEVFKYTLCMYVYIYNIYRYLYY